MESFNVFNRPLRIRPATQLDLDWLVDVDRRDEGVAWTNPRQWTDSEVRDHRRLVHSLIDADGARIAELDGVAIGTIMWRVRNLARTDPAHVFRQLDASLFPADGMFVEIFQLWVDPARRRRGVATALKCEVEAMARTRAIGLIYTHTEASNSHVLELNAKLGYREVRRGPIWDDIVRVSLVKRLQ